LIPRLATDQDGEVVATARAIQRTLGSAGLDYHDLAASIAGAPESHRQHPKGFEEAPFWCDLSWNERRAWLTVLSRANCLSDWEANFVADLGARTSRYGMLVSPKQEGVLNRIINKARLHGVRP
jgi:hypothetical protein